MDYNSIISILSKKQKDIYNFLSNYCNSSSQLKQQSKENDNILISKCILLFKISSLDIIDQNTNHILTNCSLLLSYLQDLKNILSFISLDFLRLLREEISSFRKLYIKYYDILSGKINNTDNIDINLTLSQELEQVFLISCNFFTQSYQIHSYLPFYCASSLSEYLQQCELLKIAAKISFQRTKILYKGINTHKYLEYVSYLLKQSLEYRKNNIELSSEQLDKCLILQTRLLSGIYYNIAVVLTKKLDYPSSIFSLQESINILNIFIDILKQSFNKQQIQNEKTYLKQKITTYSKILDTCKDKIIKMFISIQKQMITILKSSKKLPNNVLEKWFSLKQQYPRHVYYNGLSLTLIPFIESCKDNLSSKYIIELLQQQYKLESLVGLNEIPIDNNNNNNDLEVLYNIKLLREQSYQAQNIIIEYLLDNILSNTHSVSKYNEFQRGIILMQKATLIRLDDLYSLSSSIELELLSEHNKNNIIIHNTNNDIKQKQKHIRKQALQSIQESVQILYRITTKNNIKTSSPIELATSYIWFGIICLEIGGYSIDPFYNAFKILKNTILSLILPNNHFTLDNNLDNSYHNCDIYKQLYLNIKCNRNELDLDKLYEITLFLTNIYQFINEELYYIKTQLLLVLLCQKMYIIPKSVIERKNILNNDFKCNCSKDIQDFLSNYMEEGISKCTIALSNIANQYHTMGYPNKCLKYLKQCKIIIHGITPSNNDSSTDEILLSEDNSSSFEIELSDISKEEENSLNNEIIEEEHYYWIVEAQYQLQQNNTFKSKYALSQVYHILSLMNNSSYKRFYMGKYKYTECLLMIENNECLSLCLKIALEALEYKKESLKHQSGYLLNPNSSSSSFLPIIEHPYLLWRYILSITQSYEQVGYLYDLYGESDISECYYRQGLQLGQRFYLGHITVQFLLRLGELYYKQNEWDKAKNCFSQIINHLNLTILDNTKEQIQKKSALSNVSEQYRRYVEIFVNIRYGDLIFKQQQSIQKIKSLSISNNIYYSIPKKYEKDIISYYNKAKENISLLKSTKYIESISILNTKNITNTPEKIIYSMLTSPHISKLKDNNFWNITIIRIKGKLGRLDIAQGKISKAMNIFKNIISKTNHPILRANFALSLAQCHYILSNNTQDNEIKVKTRGITRCNTAPSKILQRKTKILSSSSTNNNNNNITNMKKYLISAYELIRNISPPKLTQNILKLLLYCFEYSNLSLDDKYMIYYIINNSQYITTRHKLCSKISLEKNIDNNNSINDTSNDNIDILSSQLSSLSINNNTNILFNNTPSLIKPEEIQNYLNNQLLNIPKEWTLCNISLSYNKEYIFITQIQKSKTPICIKIPFSYSLINEFNIIMKENKQSLKGTNDNITKEEWWETRKSLDIRLGKYLLKLQEDILGYNKFLLQGQPYFNNIQKENELKECINRIYNKLKKNSKVSKEIIQLYLISFHKLSLKERNLFFNTYFKGETRCQAEFHKIFLKEQISFKTNQYYPTIFLLDHELQCIPWESIPLLYSNPIHRIPNLSILEKLLSLNIWKNNNGILSIDKCFYLLNPTNDNNLYSTQDRFKDSFSKQKYWKGQIAEIPNNLSQILDPCDLYIYCGHGSSEKYIDRSIIEQKSKMPICLLMGCSSGKLISYSDSYDPNGFIISLLLGGSPSTIGYLWDITDKDCDIICANILKNITNENTFCENLLNSSKKNIKRFKSIMKHLNHPQDNFITTNIQIKDNNTIRLGDTIAQSKKYSYLPFLNGSALVSYGLPISISLK